MQIALFSLNGCMLETIYQNNCVIMRIVFFQNTPIMNEGECNDHPKSWPNQPWHSCRKLYFMKKSKLEKEKDRSVCL